MPVVEPTFVIALVETLSLAFKLLTVNVFELPDESVPSAAVDELSAKVNLNPFVP